jgi:hypothetical protein
VGCDPWCAELLRRDLQVRTRYKTIAARERLSDTAHLIRSMYFVPTAPTTPIVHGERATSEGFCAPALKCVGVGMWSWPGANVNTLFGASSLICVKTRYSRADVIADDDRVSPPIDHDPADRMVEMPTRRASHMLPRSKRAKVGSPNPAQLWRCRWAVENSCLARDRFFLLIKLGRGIVYLDQSPSSVEPHLGSARHREGMHVQAHQSPPTAQRCRGWQLSMASLWRNRLTPQRPI